MKSSKKRKINVTSPYYKSKSTKSIVPVSNIFEPSQFKTGEIMSIICVFILIGLGVFALICPECFL